MSIMELFGAVKDLAKSTPQKRALVQASMINLRSNLSIYPRLLRDVSQLYPLMTDEAQAEVCATLSLVMDDSDYAHVQAIFDDYRV